MLKLLIFLSILASCNPLGTQSKVTKDFGIRIHTHTWDFEAAADYSINDTTKISIASGAASLQTMDLTHATSAEFTGTHIGTYHDESNLTLQKSSYGELTSDWAPSYASLVGYWRLNGTVGNLTNGTTVTATIGTNGTADDNNASNLKYIPGRLSQAVSFDGTDDNIYIGDVLNMGTSSFTISAWARSTSTATVNNNGIVYKRGTASGLSPGFRLNFPNGAFNFHIADGTNLASVTSPVTTYNDGNWHHVVGVRDTTSGNLYLYVDGTQVSSAANTIGNIDSTVFLAIGALNTDGNNVYHPFTGDIDEVAIWSTALTSSQVAALYSRQSTLYADHTELSSAWTPQWASLVGYWKMDGNWKDSVGTAHGNATAGPSFVQEAAVGNFAGSFDGTNGEVEATNMVPANQPTTMAFWIKGGSTGATNYFGLFAGVESIFLHLSSVGKVYIQQGAAVCLYGTKSVNETWNHVALTRTTGGYYELYINGILDGSCTDSDTTFGGGIIRIGASLLSPTYRFTGQLDDFAIWNQILTPSEIKLLYEFQKQKYSGLYVSSIIDTGNSAAEWQITSWKTELPFLKELPGSSGAENTSNYASVITTDTLDDGLLGLWHLNETSANSATGGNDFEDTSGLGAHAFETGGTVFGNSGFLGNGLLFDGVNDFLTISSTLAPNPNDTVSISFWIRAEFPIANWAKIIEKQNGVGTGWFIQRRDNTAKIHIRVDTSAGHNQNRITTKDIIDGLTHHVVVIFNNGNYQVYVDGALDISGSYNHGTGFASSSNLYFTSPANYFAGFLDEVAIWSRALSAAEVLQLYRRGANRIKLQVRSCDDALCSGENWLGPDGTESTWFSELNNCSLLVGATGACDFGGGGQVNTDSPKLVFSDFTSLTVSDNRYFQYRILMESDDDNTSPTLSSVSLGPSKYYGDSPSVTTLSGPTFTYWEALSDSVSGGCTVTYQASRDGSLWYYYDGSVWTSAASASDANSAATASAAANKFAQNVGSGTLYLKAFLNSDTTQSCSLNEITAVVKK